MDAKKLDKLISIGYKINPCCGLCDHSYFPHNEWGVCLNHRYDHLKHDGIHNLSIHCTGLCEKDFVFKEKKLSGMNHYREFFNLE